MGNRKTIVCALAVVGLLAACSSSDDPAEQRPTTTSGGRSPVTDGFDARAAAYLADATAAPVEPGASRDLVWRAVARLASDPEADADLTVADLTTITDRIATFTDTTDFDMIALLNLWFRSDHGKRLPDETRDHVRGLILGFKYWYDEPQPAGIVDERWYWSENHQILYHALEYLAGQEFPDEVFTITGTTGADHLDHARPLIERWVEQRARYGFSEWYSNVYYEEDLEATVALAEFAADDDVATTTASRPRRAIPAASWRWPATA